MFKKLTRSIANIVNSDSLPKTVDAEFDRAKANWNIMHNVLSDIRRQLEEYRASMRGICSASNAAVDSMALLFPKPTSNTVQVTASAAGGAVAVPVSHITTSHPYSTLAHSAKSTFNQLLNEQIDACDRKLTHSCLANCAELLDKFGAIRLRVQERDELIEELDYYLNKTHNIRKELQKLTSQGKKETLKDEERRLRNEEALATSWSHSP